MCFIGGGGGDIDQYTAVTNVKKSIIKKKI